MEDVQLSCGRCGPVVVRGVSADAHHNRRDGFRLLTAPCPGCGELLATADPVAFDAAVAGGARRRELRCPLPAITTDELLELHELLADDDWCARLARGD